MSNNIFTTISGAIKNWWIPVLVGLIFIAVGIATFGNPEDAYQALALVFSLTFIVTGIAELVFSFSNRETMQGWGWLFALGILTFIVGVLMVQNQEVAQNVFPFYISFLLLFRSIMGISTAIDLRNNGILDWGTVMVIAVLGTILSFILLFNPELAGISAVYWTGAVFIVLGVMGLVLGFTFRKIKRTPQRIERNVKTAVNDARKNVSDAVDNARDNVNEAVNNVKNNVNDAIDDVSDRISGSD